jgi:hypothetical protein
MAIRILPTVDVEVTALRELLAACNELKYTAVECGDSNQEIPPEPWRRFLRALAPFNGEEPPP